MIDRKTGRKSERRKQILVNKENKRKEKTHIQEERKKTGTKPERI